MDKVFSKKVLVVGFWFILLTTFIIRILVVSDYNFPFTMDQGRDMLDLREIVYGPNLKLTGPTTSLNGVFMGPFYYYFNLVPFVIGRGDPAVLVYWQIIWYQLAGLALWLYFRKENLGLAFVASLLYLLMPLGFYTSRFAWSAHPMPMVMVGYFLLLISSIQRQVSGRKLLALGVISGLGLQTEAALGILLFPFAFLAMIASRLSFKKYLSLVAGFATTLVPQLLFEVKHGFIMTQTLMNEFSGNANILGEPSPMVEKYAQLIQLYRQLVFQTNHLHPQLVLGIFMVSAVWLAGYWLKNRTWLFSPTVKSGIDSHTSKLKSKSKTTSIMDPSLQRDDTSIRPIYLLSLSFLFCSFIFYLWMPVEIKHWYLYGLAVPMLLIMASWLAYLWTNYSRPVKLAVLLVLVWTSGTALDIHWRYYRDSLATASADPSNMKNELSAVDWVYQEADDQGFQVYNYIPSVYDFPYQYLFWWYGTQKYGYQPDAIAYLDNVPEYIPNHAQFWTQKRPADPAAPIFLIMEPDENSDRQAAWLGNFSHLCPIRNLTFPWQTKVEMRGPCPSGN